MPSELDRQIGGGVPCDLSGSARPHGDALVDGILARPVERREAVTRVINRDEENTGLEPSPGPSDV